MRRLILGIIIGATSVPIVVDQLARRSPMESDFRAWWYIGNQILIDRLGIIQMNMEVSQELRKQVIDMQKRKEQE